MFDSVKKKKGPQIVYAGVPRVNLMPRVELERRERSRLIGVWGYAALGAVVVAAVIVAGAFTISLFSSMRLSSAQAHTNELILDMSTLKDVNTVLTVQDDIESFRTEAMGVDVTWATVYGTLKKAVPTDATLTSWDLTTGGLPQSGVRLGEQTGMTGQLTITSPKAIDIVKTVRDLREVNNVLDADGAQLSGSGSGSGSDSKADEFTYRVTVQLDKTVYSGQYTPKDD